MTLTQRVDLVSGAGIAILAALALSALTGCTPAQLAKNQAIVSAACTYDANVVPGLVTAGNTTAVIVDPSSAPAVAALGAADQIAHVAVQAACASVGGVPVAVTVTAPKVP